MAAGVDSLNVAAAAAIACYGGSHRASVAAVGPAARLADQRSGLADEIGRPVSLRRCSAAGVK